MESPKIQIVLPPERVAGVFADFVSVWHTGDIFTFDFAALEQPPQMVQDDAGNSAVKAQAHIVTRVRVPPAQVFEIMKALEQQLSAWEIETGQRAEPGGIPGSEPPESPPEA